MRRSGAGFGARGGLRPPLRVSGFETLGIGPGRGAQAGSAFSYPRSLRGPSAADPRPSGRAPVPGLWAEELAYFLFVRPRRGGRRQPAPAAQPGQPAQPQQPRPPSRRPRPPAPAQLRRPCKSRPGPPAPLRGRFGRRPRRLGCPAPTGRVPAAVSEARPGLRAAAVSAGACAHGPEVKSELDSEMCGVNNATPWPVLRRGHIPFRLGLAMGGGRRWLLFAAPQRLDARHPALLHPRRPPGRGRGTRPLDGGRGGTAGRPSGVRGRGAARSAVSGPCLLCRRRPGRAALGLRPLPIGPRRHVPAISWGQPGLRGVGGCGGAHRRWGSRGRLLPHGEQHPCFPCRWGVCAPWPPLYCALVGRTMSIPDSGSWKIGILQRSV